MARHARESLDAEAIEGNEMGNANARVGGCHCGAIRFETTAASSLVEYCHCNTCRRLNGSAVSTLAGFATEAFRVTKGTPLIYESSPGTRRTFCGQCGTRLFWESEGHAHEVYVCIGAFDEPGTLPAECHVWTSDRLPWVELADELAQYPEFMKNNSRD